MKADPAFPVQWRWRTAALLGLSALLSACVASVPTQRAASDGYATPAPSQAMETLAALDQARVAHPGAFDPGSAEESAALQRFAEFFSRYAPDRVDRLLESTYAADVYFNDTLKTVRGKPALAQYLKKSSAAVDDCQIEVLDSSRTQSGEYVVRWKMKVRFKKLRRGIDTWTVGVSHLRFASDGRVVYQQDYWNAADGLYEHIPLLGALIRAIKRRQ